MSRGDDCSDNAVAERFFATLKGEPVDRVAARKAAINARFDYIHVFYDRERRHSSIGYASPAEFENAFAGLNRAAQEPCLWCLRNREDSSKSIFRPTHASAFLTHGAGRKTMLGGRAARARGRTAGEVE